MGYGLGWCWCVCLWRGGRGIERGHRRVGGDSRVIASETQQQAKPAPQHTVDRFDPSNPFCLILSVQPASTHRINRPRRRRTACFWGRQSNTHSNIPSPPCPRALSKRRRSEEVQERKSKRTRAYCSFVPCMLCAGSFIDWLINLDWSIACFGASRHRLGLAESSLSPLLPSNNRPRPTSNGQRLLRAAAAAVSERGRDTG